MLFRILFGKEKEVSRETMLNVVITALLDTLPGTEKGHQKCSENKLLYVRISS